MSVVNFPRKNQEKFFSHAPLQITKNPQKPLWDALSSTLHRPLQAEWRNTFFHFFIKAESEYALFFGFYSNSNGE